MRRILKIFYIVSVMIISCIMMGCQAEEEALFQEVSENELDEKGTSEVISEAEEEANIFVHVCGKVKNPGVYELEGGSRVYQAVEAAGGMTKNAATDSINQAEILSDGQQLYIPSRAEIEEELSEAVSSKDGKVNINKASMEELMTLSGIGEAKADAIIRYREEHGGFKSIEEIMEIEGIKEGVFQKIEEGITVS